MYTVGAARGEILAGAVRWDVPRERLGES